MDSRNSNYTWVRIVVVVAISDRGLRCERGVDSPLVSDVAGVDADVMGSDAPWLSAGIASLTARVIGDDICGNQWHELHAGRTYRC